MLGKNKISRFLLVFVLLVGCAPVSSIRDLVIPERPGERVLLLDWIIYGKHAPFLAAKDLGFFAREGLNIRIERGYGSGNTIRKVGDKKATFGFADAGSVIVARAVAAKVVIVAMIHPNLQHALYFLEDNAISHPREMKGWKGGDTPVSAVRILFPTFARKAGLDPDNVTWVNMPFSDKHGSLFAGKVHFIPGYTTEGVILRLKARVAGKVVKEMLYRDYGLDIYGSGLIVHEDTIKENPDLVRRLVKANLEAWAYCLTNRKKCLENFYKYAHDTTKDGWIYKYARNLTKEVIDGHFAEAMKLVVDEGVKRNGLGWMDFKKMAETVDIMTKSLSLKRRIDTKEVYTNRFLPKLTVPKEFLSP